jgi:hypothetical protein
MPADSHPEGNKMSITLSGVQSRIPWLGLIAASIALVIVGIALVRHDSDPMEFVLLGRRYYPHDPKAPVGYDGQFAYAIAVNPLGAAPLLDDPAYRYQRILYPMLARAMALGQPELVPWTLIVLNVLVLTIGTELLGQHLIRRGLRPWYGLLFVLWVGQWFALRFDLQEPLSLALALAALALLDRKRVWLAAVTFGLGGLTKDIALLFCLGAAASAFMSRRIWPGVTLLLGGLLPYLLWSVVLSSIFKTGVFQSSAATMEWIPFNGLRFCPPGLLGLALLWLIAPAALAIWIIVSRRSMMQKSWPLWVTLANIAFLAFLPRSSYGDGIALLRLGGGLVISIMILTAMCAPRALRYLAALWGISPILAVLIPGFF